MQYELRPFWRKIFQFNWKFGLFLVLLICIPRFILVLNANRSGNYGAIGLIMFISALTPFLFLTKYGRKKILLTQPKSYKWLLMAIIAGLAFSLLLYDLGHSLYGNHYQNWYTYISRSYKIPPGINPQDKAVMFAIVAITGMLFSPIGEELFFRGIVHASFANSLGDKNASLIDSSTFALAHISHFGLVYINQQWTLLSIPTLVWVCSMFLASLLFITFRNYSNSLAGAIICHAAFNLGMTYCIFYFL